MKRRQIRLPYEEAANIRGVETLLFLARPDALPDGVFVYHIYIDKKKRKEKGTDVFNIRSTVWSLCSKQL